MTRARYLLNLERRANEITNLAVDRLFEGRSLEEMEFFSVHGYFAEACDRSRRIERSFVSLGMKTTIFLEPE